MKVSLPRRVSCAALAVCAALLAACTPTARTGGPAPDAGGTPDTRAWNAQSPANEISRWVRRECGSRLRNKQVCVERTLVALIDPTGIGRTMEVLDTLVATDGDVRANAHPLAHGLGIAAYRSPETMAATFAACPPTQMSGCYHGVVQGYFLALARQGRLPGTAELDAMCEPHRGTTFLFFQCAHGMGHGLMAVHQNHVPMSLDACDLATDAFVRNSCYGGVFMENLVSVTHPHHTAGGHAGTQDGHQGHDAPPAAADPHAAHGEHGEHAAGAQGPAMRHGPWRALDRNDPLYPCNAVDGKYQDACYMMQTSAILYFNGSDVAATGRACERAPEAMQAACFGSLGRDITALAAQNHARSLELCGRTAGQAGGRGTLWCTLGVVQNLVNVAADPGEGLRFCRVVAGDDAKRQCYRAVGEMIRTLVNAPAQRSETCTGAEPAYAASCRAGAGVETSAGSDE